jgi:hypothetical protein
MKKCQWARTGCRFVSSFFILTSTFAFEPLQTDVGKTDRRHVPPRSPVRLAAMGSGAMRHSEMGSATVRVAVFGVAPKTLQPTNLSNEGSGATPEPARETRALPPI